MQRIADLCKIVRHLQNFLPRFLKKLPRFWENLRRFLEKLPRFFSPFVRITK